MWQCIHCKYECTLTQCGKPLKYCMECGKSQSEEKCINQEQDYEAKKVTVDLEGINDVVSCARLLPSMISSTGDAAAAPFSYQIIGHQIPNC